MKKFILIWAIMFLFSIPSFASDWSVDGKASKYFPIDDEVQSGFSFQGNLQWKQLYLFIQGMTDIERRIAGQRAGKVNIIGAGLGLKIPLTDQIKLWFQGGYYFPESKMEGEGKFEEAQWLQWRQWGHNFSYNTDGYRIYEYDIKPDLGGAAGLEANFLVYKNISLGVDAGYHFLRFKEQFWTRNPACPDISYIETRQEKDFSGFTLGLNLTWRF